MSGERIFGVDIGIILFFLGAAAWMFRSAFRDIQQDWPRLIYVAGLAWVVGFILFNRWRRRHAAHSHEPLLAHVEWSIKDIEHQMWLDRYSPWWYILPIALGCMIPPVLLFPMEYNKNPGIQSQIDLLFTEGVFAATFIFVYLIMKFGVRICNREASPGTAGASALRESLLDTEQ